MFKIICCAGIGDTIRHLSLFPHEFLYRTLGYRTGAVFIQFDIVEGQSARGAGLAHAGFPKGDFFQELISRFPSLRWLGESKGKEIFGRSLSKALRDTINIPHWKSPTYFPVTPYLSEKELLMLPAGEQPLIGIQTHLSGMKTKQWGIGNWTTFLRLFLERWKNCRVVLFDSSPQVTQLVISDRIWTTLDLNIAQSIRLVSRLKFLISIDSWAKYVAKASRVPQLIIVPDQRPEYPELTAEALPQKYFLGFDDDPLVSLVGFEPKVPALTLAKMADLEPKVLLRNLERASDYFVGS